MTRARLILSCVVWVSLQLDVFAQRSEQQSGLSFPVFGDNNGSIGTTLPATLRGSLLLTGSYVSSKKNPRVFMTPADINDIAKRINSSGSFSARNFSRLANQVKADLAANVDWDAVYSGCDIDVYLHTFSIVQTAGYASQNRSASELSSAMNVKTGSTPVTGAAVVASQLALYAALVKAGAHAPPGSPSADASAALAKRILLAWARRGFRDREGNFLQSATKFCEGNTGVSHGSEAAVGLQIGRGVAYSVHAQDLLQSIGALNANEVSELTAFHRAMFNLIFQASNFREALPEMNGPGTACEHYSNHLGVHLFALIALSRLLDDQRKFTAVLNGNDRSMPLAVPWTSYFEHALYGEHDRPIDCHKNRGPDSLSSHPFFSTNLVAPGEILDRYRDDTPSQGFGYPLGLLAILYSTADVITNAGFDAFNYRGSHHQSLELSTQYYACYGTHVGFKKPVTSDNARECSDYQQYVGQIVNGLEEDIGLGSYRFPKNTVITALEEPAKAELLRDPIDSIHFGRWRN